MNTPNSGEPVPQACSPSLVQHLAPSACNTANPTVIEPLKPIVAEKQGKIMEFMRGTPALVQVAIMVNRRRPVMNHADGDKNALTDGRHCRAVHSCPNGQFAIRIEANQAGECGRNAWPEKPTSSCLASAHVHTWASGTVQAVPALSFLPREQWSWRSPKGMCSLEVDVRMDGWRGREVSNSSTTAAHA